MKRYLITAAVFAALMILTSCSNKESMETSQIEQSPNATVSEPAVTETSKPETTSAEETAAEAAAETAGEDGYKIRTGLGNDKRTSEYLTAMQGCEDFLDALSGAAQAQIVDIDSDSTPEIVITIATIARFAAVFSIDENGGAFMVQPAEDSYASFALDQAATSVYLSYDGDILELYKKDGKNVFLTKSYAGGSVHGGGDIIEVSFENGRIVSRAVCGYEYSGRAIESEYRYYFGSTDNIISEEEYNAALEEYMSDYEYSGDFSYVIRREDMLDAKHNKQLANLAKGLDYFYAYRDSANLLDSGLPYTVENKMISSHEEYRNEQGEVTDEYFHISRYDAAGNEIYYSANYYAEGNRQGKYQYHYDYKPDGSYSSYTRTHDGETTVYEVNEYGDIINGDEEYEYDSEGRLISKIWYNDNAKKSVYTYDKYSYSPDGRLAASEYFKVRGRDLTESQSNRYVYEKNRTLVYSTYNFSREDGYEYIYGTEYENGTEFLRSETQYDGNGNIIKEIYYASDGRKRVQYDYRYDENGNKIYEERSVPDGLYEPKDSIQEYVYTYSYDGNGNLAVSTFEYWVQKQSTSYEYDKYGNVTKTVLVITGEDNEMDGIYVGEYLTEYSYEYDLKGGVVKSEEYAYERVDSLEDETPWKNRITTKYYQPVKVIGGED